MKALTSIGTVVTTLAIALVGLAAAQDHGHGSPHGGQVKTVGKYHLEALVKDSMLHVYLLDEKEKSLPPPREGRAVLQMGKMKHDLKLAASGDMLMADLPPEAAKHLAEPSAKGVAVVTLTLDGKPQSARFSLGGEKPAAGTKPGSPKKTAKPGAHEHGDKH